MIVLHTLLKANTQKNTGTVNFILSAFHMFVIIQNKMIPISNSRQISVIISISIFKKWWEYLYLLPKENCN